MQDRYVSLAPLRPWLVIGMLILCGIACSSIDDVIGQRVPGPTPTVSLFATATPGGRISVMLTTPVGGVDAGPTPTGFGQIIGPAATATAAYATLQAATLTAAAPVNLPAYQSGECPPPGVPLPPAPPTSFSQYPEVIGHYLSSGGPTTVLESMLRSWKAFAEGAVIQSDSDLTGDGIPEIIVTIYDPVYYQPGGPSAGQLLVYGCAQKGYRLLYSTQYNPTTMTPVLRRVGGMNGDLRNKLVYTQKVCANGNTAQCTETMQIVSWDESLGVFQPLNNAPIDTTNSKIGIADIDGDGILEISVVHLPNADPGAGPSRKMTDVWDWDGTNYILAVTELEPAVYRIQAVYDADFYFSQSDWKNAVKLYDRVHDDPKLQAWTTPNEQPILAAYATYKKMLVEVIAKQPRSTSQVFAALQTENPPGSPGEGFVTMAQAFNDNYGKTRSRTKACAAALGIAAGRPELLSTLNSYGYANRTYSLTDLCSLTDSQIATKTSGK